MEKILLILLSFLTSIGVYAHLKYKLKIDQNILFIGGVILLIYISFYLFAHYSSFSKINEVLLLFFSTLILVSMFRIMKAINKEEMLTDKVLKVVFIKKWYKLMIVILYLVIQISQIFAENSVFGFLHSTQ